MALFCPFPHFHVKIFSFKKSSSVTHNIIWVSNTVLRLNDPIPRKSMKRRTHPSNYRFESKKNRWWQLYGNLPYNFLSWCINSKQDANKFFRSEKKLFSSWEKWIFLTNVIMIFWINTPLYQMFFPIKRSYYIFKKFIKALGVYWWKYVIPLTKVLGFGIYFYA